MTRLWVIAQIAKTFHVLPSVAARDLYTDPEQLSLVCVPLLNYADAKAAYDAAKGDPDKLKAWEGSSLMDTVVANVFASHKVRLDHRAHIEPDPSCRLCRR